MYGIQTEAPLRPCSVAGVYLRLIFLLIFESPKPGGGYEEKVVYGSMQDIDNLQSAIKKNPDAAMRSVKFIGNPGNSQFYLGKPASEVRHPQPSKSDALAARWYQDSNPDQPETTKQQELRETREHVKESLA